MTDAPTEPTDALPAPLVVQWGTFPLVLFGGLALASVQLEGVPPAALAALTIALGWLLLLGFERIWPETPAWTPPRRTLLLDLFHNVFSAGAVGKAFELGLLLVFAKLAAHVPGSEPVWPRAWPLPLQIALALVIHDFGVYWTHRTFHLVAGLWRIHALHHSSERLHALATGRSHPLNVISYQLASLTPLLLLGAGERVLLLVGVFTALIGLLQHANVPLRCGAFNLVLATPELHRWHHSRVLEESNTNFGGNLILWDWVFRTRFLPSDRRARHDVGIDNVVFPEALVDHLLSPLRIDAWEEEFARAHPAPADPPSDPAAP